MSLKNNFVNSEFVCRTRLSQDCLVWEHSQQLLVRHLRLRWRCSEGVQVSEGGGQGVQGTSHHGEDQSQAHEQDQQQREQTRTTAASLQWVQTTHECSDLARSDSSAHSRVSPGQHVQQLEHDEQSQLPWPQHWRITSQCRSSSSDAGQLSCRGDCQQCQQHDNANHEHSLSTGSTHASTALSGMLMIVISWYL